MKASLILILAVILISFKAAAQESKFKLNFPKPIGVSYYNPSYKEALFHTMDGVGNVSEPYDSIKVAPLDVANFQGNPVVDSLMQIFRNQKRGFEILVDPSQTTTIDLNIYSTYRLNKTYSSYPRKIRTKSRNGKLSVRDLDTMSLTTTNPELPINLTVLAQPVYIANLTKGSRLIEGPDAHLIISQQAKDKNNNWVDIETNDVIECGMAKTFYLLKPGDFVITKVLKFKGNYKTQIRIKLELDNHIYYSKPFVGYIDYNQIYNPKIKLIDGEPYERL